MKCNWEWLSAYLDGLLSDDKRAKLEEHLKTCEACTAKLEEFARVEVTAKKIPAPQLSEAYWENFASRVQNKLTIRERQKISPAWLEALKSFFQPTTGKLAIAGSLAAILLVAIIGQDYWKKEAYQPPKFEAVAPLTNDKTGSIQEPAKDESVFRTARPDENKAAAEKKRKNEIASAKAANEGILDSRENTPAALAPAEIASKSAGRQKSKEEPSLIGYMERDEAIPGDTVFVTAGKEAEIRKMTTTSQVKVDAEEIEKLPVSNVEDFSNLRSGTLKRDTRKRSRFPVQRDTLREKRLRAHYDSIKAVQHNSGRRGALLIDSVSGSLAPRMPAIDTAQLVADIRQIIAEKEKQLRGTLSKTETESLYIYLAQHYVQLYRFSLDEADWRKANQRLADFLKADLSEFNRRWLVAIQAELQKLKK